MTEQENAPSIVADSTETTEHEQEEEEWNEESPINSETSLTSPNSPNNDRNLYSEPISKTPQILAALAATIGAFGLGTVVAWSSPAIPSLEEDVHFKGLTATERTWIGSIVTLGAALSTLISGPIIDWIGRKGTLIALGFPFIFGWLLVSFSTTLGMMLVGRFITGFCGGAFSLIVPVYCSEISQSEIRGALGSLMVLLLVAGILFVNIVGTFTNWFWLSIICTFVPIIFLVCMVFSPESPTFLLMKNKQIKAKLALQVLRGNPNEGVSQELSQIQRSLDEMYAQPLELTKPYIIKPFGICLALMFLQQASLINIVVFYTVKIFRSAGSTIDPNTCSIIVASVQLVCCGLAIFLVDRVGRKLLLLLSSIGISVSLGVLGFYYHLYSQNHGEAPANLGWLPLTSLVVFIITYNLGLGPLPWCLLSELMGSRVKSYTSAMSASFCWILAFFVTKYVPDLETWLGEAISYWIFTGLSLLGVIFAIFIVPETKGKSLDEIQRLFR